MKRMASERKKSKSNGIPSKRGSRAKFAICVDNKDYPASLERGKVYKVLPDSFGEEHNLIRVIDESGEDYLYSRKYFLPIALPQPVIRALAKAA